MTNDIDSIRHAEQRVMTNADQTEMRAIIAGSAVLETGISDNLISGELQDLDVGDEGAETWSKQDLARDGETGAIRDELLERSRILGSAYPFQVHDNTLRYQGRMDGFYEYCVAITLAPSITKKPFVQLPRTFERIVTALIRSHLGEAWAAYHTGAPRDRVNGMNFYKCMTRLSQVSSSGREWRWDPVHTFPAKPRISGDGGVDFVLWRPSPDNRIGQPYVVGQCACGNDWATKFGDINIDRLEKWFRPLTEIPITRCFTTPFWLSRGNFEVAHNEAGWVFDRGRLSLLAFEAGKDLEYGRWIPQLEPLFDLVRAAA